jgi:NTE family protein
MVIKGENMDNKPIVGLALGSGAARGLAHFGVIKALKEYDFDVQYVAGASIGAVVGAAYAAGKEDTLEDAYRHMDKKKIFSLFDLVFPGASIMEGNKVSDFVHQHLGLSDFSNLHKELGIITTDLLTGTEVVLTKGDLKQAIKASFAVPGIMKPVLMDEYMLLDGGMVNPVPVSTVKNMGADLIIAVDVNHYLLESNVAQLKSVKSKRSVESLENDKKNIIEPPIGNSIESAVESIVDRKVSSEEKEQNEEQLLNQSSWIDKLNHKLSNIEMPALDKFKKWTDKEPLPGIFSVMMASVDIMERQIAKSQLKECPPDILIKPKVGDYKFLDFDHADELIQAGYEAAKEAIDAYLEKQATIASQDSNNKSLLSRIFS